jgi:hypothetical protein
MSWLYSRALVGESNVKKFELEKMAIEYCTQYGIADDDPRRDDIINAFCVGAKIEREACANLAELCDDQESAARFIRARSTFFNGERNGF